MGPAERAAWGPASFTVRHRRAKHPPALFVRGKMGCRAVVAECQRLTGEPSRDDEVSRECATVPPPHRRDLGEDATSRAVRIQEQAVSARTPGDRSRRTGRDDGNEGRDQSRHLPEAPAPRRDGMPLDAVMRPRPNRLAQRDRAALADSNTGPHQTPELAPVPSRSVCG